MMQRSAGPGLVLFGGGEASQGFNCYCRSESILRTQSEEYNRLRSCGTAAEPPTVLYLRAYLDFKIVFPFYIGDSGPPSR